MANPTFNWSQSEIDQSRSFFGSKPTDQQIYQVASDKGLNTEQLADLYSKSTNVSYDDALKNTNNWLSKNNLALGGTNKSYTPGMLDYANPAKGGVLTSFSNITTNAGNTIPTGAAITDPNSVSGYYNNPQKIDLSGINAPTYENVNPFGFDQVKAGSAKVTSAPSNVSGYNAQQINVSNDMLVENRLNNLLKQDNPLMQKARAEGLQRANASGLLNSSMAAEASQKAVIDSAMAIAQKDADTYVGVARSNQEAANEAARFLATAQNQRDIDNAKMQTEVAIQNVKMQLDAALANQDNARTVLLTNAKNNLDAQLAVYNTQASAATTNAQMENNMKIAQGNAVADIIRGNQAAISDWNKMTSQQQFTAEQNYNNELNGISMYVANQIAAIQNSDAPADQKKIGIQAFNNVGESLVQLANMRYALMPSMVAEFKGIQGKDGENMFVTLD